jgi:hypothetical protein
MTPQTRGFFLSTALSDRLSTHFIDNSPHEEDLTRVRRTISPIGACSTASLLTRPLPCKGDRTWKGESGMDERPVIISVADIESRIFLIRGQKVMLDADLAVLYGVETFNFNKAVKRNVDRFPEDFMFQLTKGELGEKGCEEADSLRFQIGMSKALRGEAAEDTFPMPLRNRAWRCFRAFSTVNAQSRSISPLCGPL